MEPLKRRASKQIRVNLCRRTPLGLAKLVFAQGATNYPMVMVVHMERPEKQA